MDLVAELEALLAAWRERHASKLAHAIDDLASWFDLAQSPLPGSSRTERQTAWLALAKPRRSIDLGELLRTAAHGSSDQTTEQLETLARWPCDPRTTWLARRLFETKPYATSSGTQKVWRRLFDVIAHHGDPRAWPLLAPGPMAKVFAANERGRKMRQRAANVVVDLEQIREVQAPGDDAWIARIERELAKGRALHDAVRIDADEEGREQAHADALLVYRDWLMERGFTPVASTVTGP